MNYVDGIVCAVPAANKQKYIAYAQIFVTLFKEAGAIRLVDCWADDVPDGKLTSFPMAVKREADEVVVFSWIEWPSKEVRDQAWKNLMDDPRMQPGPDNPMPYDGKRMIYGGFQMIVQG
ncbi:MAG: DUF1428 domain-containing protein [Burkholderiaceae bacterium]|nr:DUF1428 domain-containing protein [Burkholderiaceae bacterium]